MRSICIFASSLALSTVPAAYAQTGYTQSICSGGQSDYVGSNKAVPPATVTCDAQYAYVGLAAGNDLPTSWTADTCAQPYTTSCGSSVCGTWSSVQYDTCCTSGITACAALSATDDKADDKSIASCFSGEDTVTLESGALKPLADVLVGDRILSSDSQGKLSFSDVVFLPHGANTQKATFVEITTASKVVKATQMHLFQTCDGALAYAGSLKNGDCLRTIDGGEAITSTKLTIASGLYTAVTQNEFLVVNGVIASPFAVAHGITNAYYNIHRALYKLAPSVLKSPAVISANALLGSTVVRAASFFSTGK